MKCFYSLLKLSMVAILAIPVASNAANVFTLGNDDGSAADFSQEKGSQAAPGSATLQDDDYYFAGTYGIGVFAADEDWKNFDRVVANNDPNNRIHFNLTDDNIINQELTLTVDLFAGGWWDAAAGASGGTFGTHDVSINFNGKNIWTQNDIVTDTLSEVTFSPASVNAVAGENVIEITRTGGDSKGNGGNAGWIHFDYISLESNPAAAPSVIQTFASNKTQASSVSPTATLTWQVTADPAITLSIDNEIGDVTALTNNGSGSIEVRISETTTFTLTATGVNGAETATVSIGYQSYAQLWRLGDDNNTQTEFSQENVLQPAPGSATLQDDDYYFTGTYPAPINEVNSDEDWKNFDRALTGGDPNNRIHFNLNSLEAKPESQLRLAVDLRGGGWWNAAEQKSGVGWGVHDIAIQFNGNEIYNQSGITADTKVEVEIAADEVDASENENIIEITRTGGDSRGDGSSSGWIQFDYITLEADVSNVPLTEPISSFTASKELIQPGQRISLDWRVDPTAEVSIDSGIGNVDAQTINGVGSLQITPTANTTYTLTSVRGAETETATVTVTVDLALSFTSNIATVTPDEPVARLSWSVDPNPDVTVSIDNNIGDVTALTAEGKGYIDVSPTATTTYTLTATRPNTPANDTETATAVVEFSLVYSPLWIIGENNNSNTEFGQESFQSNVPPGAATQKDDDYYLAGTYPDPINDIETNEAWANFERAITNGDPNNRIHFNLDAQQALPASEIRLTLDLFGGGWWNAAEQKSGVGWGIHDIAASFNGVQVLTSTDIVANRIVTATFNAAEVNAVAGENIIEITRTGGDSKGDGGNAGWIQFDYIAAEISEATGGIAPFLITDFRYDQALNQFSLSFPSTAGQIFLIETSADLTTWFEYDDSVEAEGNVTTYIIQLTGNESNPFFVRAQRLP